MAEKRIDIIIGARNQTAAAFADVGKNAQAMQAEIGRINAEAARSASQSAMAGIAQVLSVVGKVRMAVSLTRGSIQAMKGDIKGAAQTLEAFPVLGAIGKDLAGIGEYVFDFFTSFNAQGKGFITQVDEMIEATKKGRAEAAKNLGAEKLLHGIEKSASTALLGGMEQAMQALFEARNKQLAALQAIAARTPELAKEAAAASLLVWDVYYKGLDTLWDQERDRRQAEMERVLSIESSIRVKTLEATKQTLAAELESIKEHYRQKLQEAKTEAEKEALLREQALDEDAARDREMERQKRHADDLLGLQSELQQKLLAADNKPLEAQLERIREHYRRRFELAKDAAERELLVQLQAEDEAEARRGQRASRGGIAGVQLGNSFLGLQARFAGGQDPASDTAKNTRQVVKLLADLLKSTKQIEGRPPIQLGTHVIRA